MDIKSRKSSKLAKVIITLCIIMPAVLLVSLYPTMEKAMIGKQNYYQELLEKDQENAGEWVLPNEIVHFAVEASFCMYAEMRNYALGDSIDIGVFNEYGWNSDCAAIKDGTLYFARYYPEEGQDPIDQTNGKTLQAPVARLELAFDQYGNITRVELIEHQDVYIMDQDFFGAAQASVEQFSGNLHGYNQNYDKSLAVSDYQPKNFTLIIDIDESSPFTDTYEQWFGHPYQYISKERLYFETGAYWVVVLAALFVVFVAMVLPFIKGLNTGREKIFSIPFEIMLLFAAGGVAGILGMCFLMSRTTMVEMDAIVESFGYGELVFLGSEVTPGTLYNVVRGLSVVSWSILFFIVYMVASNVRQFLANPMQYMKRQTLLSFVIRWLKDKITGIWNDVTDVDLNNNIDKSILKIVVINFLILALFCCLWLFGIVGLIAYSITLFVILRKRALIVQKQYQSVLNATEKMAEGDLRITLEEDLGPFQAVGASLERVQQGFEKAVVEEAKSQNMKTELITNVSHDLKTPLTAIITYVNLLKKEDITEEERKVYVNTLDQKSQRLKVLIEDLFEVSKAQSGNVTMNYMDVDVVSLMKQVKSEMSDQIGASGLDFRWNMPEERIVLSLDGQRTYRVFENLIGNALKYSMPFSRVYVDLMQSESEVKIMFRNMSAQELDFDPQRLTDRFVRGDQSRNSDGSGLGLAIAKSFVELQKGTFVIEVDGDLFKVILTWNR